MTSVLHTAIGLIFLAICIAVALILADAANGPTPDPTNPPSYERFPSN